VTERNDMSNDTNTGGPAFPNPHYVNHKGMTLRDYFAAKAMQGLLADSEVSGTPNEFALRSYAMADAMIQARDAK
jgi:hypothetical protein